MSLNALRTVSSVVKLCYYSQRNISSTFKSAHSLSHLYPHSSLNLATVVKVPQNENGVFTGFIPVDKLDISYSRSSGPGGQHINKVNTKVDVRFHLLSAEWLSEETKALLAKKYRGHINRDGYFIVRSDKTRSQIYNQADAITKLRELIFEALESSVARVPSEETLHMLRRRKERANMDRLLRKRNHSQTKSDRKIPDI